MISSPFAIKTYLEFCLRDFESLKQFSDERDFSKRLSYAFKAGKALENAKKGASADQALGVLELYRESAQNFLNYYAPLLMLIHRRWGTTQQLLFKLTKDSSAESLKLLKHEAITLEFNVLETLTYSSLIEHVTEEQVDNQIFKLMNLLKSEEVSSAIEQQAFWGPKDWRSEALKRHFKLVGAWEILADEYWIERELNSGDRTIVQRLGEGE